MSENKLKVGDCFEPVSEACAWGIYDTELKEFVRCKMSGKSAWAKKNHAACAFANAVSDYYWRYRHANTERKPSNLIKDNPRYIIAQYSSTETYRLNEPVDN